MADYLLFDTTTTHYSLSFLLCAHWFLNIKNSNKASDYNNTTNTPTRLHLSEMKRISGSHYFIYMFANLTSQHVPVNEK